MALNHLTLRRRELVWDIYKDNKGCFPPTDRIGKGTFPIVPW
mgnify:CR=1 FL=1